MRRIRTGLYWIAGLAFLIGLLPVLSVVVASEIARANDCILHEGFPNPCIILGSDRGELLYAMGMMGWFMLVSLPLAALGLVGLLVLLLIDLLRYFFGRGG